MQIQGLNVQMPHALWQKNQLTDILASVYTSEYFRGGETPAVYLNDFEMSISHPSGLNRFKT